MDLAPYLDQLRQGLAVAGQAGGDDARALAERLTAPLESTARLAFLEALSAAADEITRDLAPGSVEIRLRGREAEFVVTPPPPADFEFGQPAAAVPPPSPVPQEAEDGGTSRVTLRLPEHLKPRIEEAAGREGLSVNAWLVRAVSAALDPVEARRPGRAPGQSLGQRYTGWVS
jgi:hypothetical protein